PSVDDDHRRISLLLHARDRIGQVKIRLLAPPGFQVLDIALDADALGRLLRHLAKRGNRGENRQKAECRSLHGLAPFVADREQERLRPWALLLCTSTTYSSAERATASQGTATLTPLAAHLTIVLVRNP